MSIYVFIIDMESPVRFPGAFCRSKRCVGNAGSFLPSLEKDLLLFTYASLIPE